jgi:hypothetical protein
VDSHPGRGRFVASLLVATLVVSVGAFGLFRSSLFHAFQRALPAPVVLPSAEPVVPIPHIEVTETALLLDGTKLLDLPSLEEQAKDGVGKRNEVPDKFLEIAALRDALKPLRALPHQGVKVSITLAPSTPFRTFLAVLFSVGQGGFGRYRLEVVATSRTPSVALDTYAPASRSPGEQKDDERKEVHSLVAKVGRAHVDLQARSNARWEHIGFGCAPGGLGYSAHLGDPDDNATLGACLKKLTGESPAQTGASGIVTATMETPALVLLQVASLMQCGEPSCPQGPPQPPLFEGPLFSVSSASDPEPEAPEELKPAIWGLRKRFAACYADLVDTDPQASNYDLVLHIAVDPDGRGQVSIDPGAPATLGQCLVSSTERAQIRYPRRAKGLQIKIPISLVR